MRSILFGALTVLAFTGSAVAEAPPLVVQVARQANISEAAAREQIERVVNAIKEELRGGRDVTIRNFGRFYVQERDARTGRNPRTGEAIEIPAKRYPRFSSSESFKDDLNASPSEGATVAAAKG